MDEKLSDNIPPSIQNNVTPSSSKITLLVTAFIFLCVGIALGWYFKGTLQTNNETLVTISPTIIQPTTTPLSQPNSLKTYMHTANNHQYRFDYPSDWKVELAGDSKYEHKYPYVSKIDGSYSSIIFAYVTNKGDNKLNVSTDKLEKTSINGLETSIIRRQFTGDGYQNQYIITIAPDEYIVASMPIENPNIPVKPEDEIVKTAEKIIQSFKLIQ